MIQRIQSVYLLLAAAAMGAYLWFPLIALSGTNYSEPIPGWDVRMAMMGYVVYFNLIFSATAVALSFINIFLFKFRSVQQLLCAFTNVFIIAAISFVYYRYQTKIFIGDVLFTWWNVLPALALLLQFLAYRSIKSDEELVRSVDRLR